MINRALLVVLLSLTACTSASDGSTSRAPDTAPSTSLELTLGILDTAPVPSLCEHPAGRLQAGSLPGIADGAGYVELRQAQLADLDEAGASELVALSACNAGGNTEFESLLVYRDGPELAASLDLSAEGFVVVRTIDVSFGLIVVRGLAIGPDDPQAGPTQLVVRAYRLEGDRLVPHPVEDEVDPTCFDGPVDEAVCDFVAAVQSGQADQLSDRARVAAGDASDQPRGPWQLAGCVPAGDVAEQCSVHFASVPPGLDYAAYLVVPVSGGDTVTARDGEALRYEVVSFEGLADAPVEDS